MSPTTNNRGQRRTEHHFYAEIVADITTQNSERKHTTPSVSLSWCTTFRDFIIQTKTTKIGIQRIKYEFPESVEKSLRNRSFNTLRKSLGNISILYIYFK
jgi:hypothetical protein